MTTATANAQAVQKLLADLTSENANRAGQRMKAAQRLVEAEVPLDRHGPEPKSFPAKLALYTCLTESKRPIAAQERALAYSQKLLATS